MQTKLKPRRETIRVLVLKSAELKNIVSGQEAPPPVICSSTASTGGGG